LTLLEEAKLAGLEAADTALAGYRADMVGSGNHVGVSARNEYLGEDPDFLQFDYVKVSPDSTFLGDDAQWTRGSGGAVALATDVVHPRLVTKRENIKAQLQRMNEVERRQVVLDLIEESLSAESLRAIRATAQRQLEAKSPSGSVSDVDEQAKATLLTTTKRLVFGEDEPSVGGFRQFVISLTSRGTTTFEEKKEIVRAINAWKDELGVELIFQGQPCSISPNSDAGNGTFRVRDTGQTKTLYGRTSFPKLQVVRKRR
jgi:hypothetical protein